ncbi:MAG: DUF3253 domain-containing protein [Pseudomonadota bacterium]
MPRPSDDEIAFALLRLAEERAPKTFCPSEVARRLAADWRPLMPDIRRVAADLPLIATQRGQLTDALKARGPIRLQKRNKIYPLR